MEDTQAGELFLNGKGNILFVLLRKMIPCFLKTGRGSKSEGVW